MAADPRSSRAESSRWRRSADGGDALSDQSCAMCVGEGAPPVHRVRSGSAIDLSLCRGAVATVLPWSQVGQPLSWHPCTWAAPLCPGETCPNRHARILRTPYATSTATGSSGFFHTPWKAQLTSGCVPGLPLMVLGGLLHRSRSWRGAVLTLHSLVGLLYRPVVASHLPRASGSPRHQSAPSERQSLSWGGSLRPYNHTHKKTRTQSIVLRWCE